MKKFLILIMVLVALIFALAGCSDSKAEGEDTETTSDIWGDDEWWVTEPSSDNADSSAQDDQNQQNNDFTNDNNSINNNTNGQQNNNTITPDNGNNGQSNTNNNQGNTSDNNNSSGNSGSSSGNGLISDEDMSKLEESNAEVYFSDNPNNKYIVQVVNKYGVDSSNLVALVKVNATFPSAMVLEFSGKRDANGELVMTYSELKYVYNIDESKGTLVKASKNGIGNDGVSFVESKILFALMENYFCPELPNLKANKRYD